MSAAMTVRIKKSKEGYPEAYTFPLAEAELTTKIIDELGLKKGLEKFGKSFKEKNENQRGLRPEGGE